MADAVVSGGIGRDAFVRAGVGRRAPGEPASTDGWVALVRAAAEGNEVAREALLAELRPLVVRYCRGRLGRMAGSHDLADDVAQEVCAAVLGTLPRYRDMGLPFMAFVYRIASNKIADAQRREFRSAAPVAEPPDEVDTAPGPESAALRIREAQRARWLLDHLSEWQREVVWLRVATGLSAAETGRVVGMSPGTVRVTQYRALQRLRVLADGAA